MKKVKVCKRCSNFNKDEIAAYAKENNCHLDFGCMSRCKKKYPELREKFFGRINGNLTICDSKEDFFCQMKQ